MQSLVYKIGGHENMNKKDRIAQIVTAANQNIDIVNKSTDLKLSNVGINITVQRW